MNGNIKDKKPKNGGNLQRVEYFFTAFYMVNDFIVQCQTVSQTILVGHLSSHFSVLVLQQVLSYQEETLNMLSRQ